MKRKFLVRLIICWFFATSNLMAQGSMGDAINLSHANRFQEANDLFVRLLSQTPDDPLVNLHMAYNSSWQGLHDKAKVHFLKAMKDEGLEIESNAGIAYNYYYSNQISNAIQYFKIVLQKDPFNKNALIGLSHCYLASDNLNGAEYTLNIIEQNCILDKEYYLLLGLINEKKLHRKYAIDAYKTAQKEGFDQNFIKEKLNTFDPLPNKYNINLWHGSYLSGGKWIHTLNRIDFLVRLNQNFDVYGGISNSLFYPHAHILNDKITNPYIFFGSKKRLKKNWFGKFELGYRLNNQYSNDLVASVEQILFVSNKIVVNPILSFNHNDIENLLTYGINLELALKPSLRMGTGIFDMHNFRFSNSKNRRITFLAKYQRKGIEFISGFNIDQVIIGEFKDQGLLGYYFMCSFPILSGLSGRVLFRKENSFFFDSIYLFSSSLSYSF